jgi:hypothetical protein
LQNPSNEIDRENYNKIYTSLETLTGKKPENIPENPEIMTQEDAKKLLKQVNNSLKGYGQEQSPTQEVEQKIVKPKSKAQKMIHNIRHTVSKAWNKLVGKEQKQESKQESKIVQEIKTEQNRTKSFVEKILAERKQNNRGSNLSI